MPDFPEGTSPALTQHYHVRAEKIVQEVGKITESKVEYESFVSFVIILMIFQVIGLRDHFKNVTPRVF